ncbi:hypothetical protein J3458_009384 [Metarhizium acridum]|uniref:uncharacterized protein n=1 Tax=Metarhizium acridum TaxID=92637 RepID=UPI001C6C9FDE|nr:hypothetical protein J3458_009384 [Metarhizium acridum]
MPPWPFCVFVVDCKHPSKRRAVHSRPSVRKTPFLPETLIIQDISMGRPGIPLSYGISSASVCKALCFGMGAAVAAIAIPAALSNLALRERRHRGVHCGQVH